MRRRRSARWLRRDAREGVDLIKSSPLPPSASSSVAVVVGSFLSFVSQVDDIFWLHFLHKN